MTVAPATARDAEAVAAPGTGEGTAGRNPPARPGEARASATESRPPGLTWPAPPRRASAQDAPGAVQDTTAPEPRPTEARRSGRRGRGRAAVRAASDASATELVAVVRGVPRYHEPDCVLIRFMPDSDVQRTTIPQAKDDGCTPCAACQPPA